MTRPVDIAVTAADEVCELHNARAAAELLAADALAPGADAVAWRGASMATVVVVKGLPGPAETSGGAALSGADGEAATKALGALGYPDHELFFTLSRPSTGVVPERVAARLRAQIEAVDPAVVLALDAEARSDVAAAFEITPPAWGREARILGRRIVAVDGLEASLGEPARKRRVWEQLKAARAEGPVY